jgi:hypothetical protein
MGEKAKKKIIIINFFCHSLLGAGGPAGSYARKNKNKNKNKNIFFFPRRWPRRRQNKNKNKLINKNSFFVGDLVERRGAACA